MRALIAMLAALGAGIPARVRSRLRRTVIRTELRDPAAEPRRGQVAGFNARLPRHMNRAQRRRWAARAWESRHRRDNVLRGGGRAS